MAKNTIVDIQFSVSTEDIISVAEILDAADLSNRIVSGDEDEGTIMIEIDYDETDADEMKAVLDITKIVEGYQE